MTKLIVLRQRTKNREEHSHKSDHVSLRKTWLDKGSPENLCASLVFHDGRIVVYIY